MIKELLPKTGKFYKVNFHTHTTLSDGSLTPEETKEHFKSLGYSAVCFTDHDKFITHDDLCDDEFIALHGNEVALKPLSYFENQPFAPTCHINFFATKQSIREMPVYLTPYDELDDDAKAVIKLRNYNVTDDLTKFKPYDMKWLNKYIAAMNEAGFVAVFNHPQWSLQTCNDYLVLDNLFGIEVVNGESTLHNDNTSIHYETMLRAGMNVIPVAGDDNHSKSFAGKAWTMIKADELSFDALMAAFKRGDCYASCGPEIHELYIEDGEVVVKCSPAESVTLFSEGRGLEIKTSSDADLTEVRLPYRPERYGRFFRIEVRDCNRRAAFSRAYLPEHINI